MLRKYRQWVLLPLILLGVQWLVSYWHHHEEASPQETHVTSSHEECFVCDWVVLASANQVEVPLVTILVGFLIYVATAYVLVNKNNHSTEVFTFFFGRAPPVLIR